MIYPIHTGVLVLGYFIIVTSWIGYFKSVRSSPHKENRYGLLRFGVDLLIVYEFFYMVSLSNPEKHVDLSGVFVWLLPAIFLTFIIWDILKYVEYRKERTKQRALRRRRTWITITFYLVFVMLSVFYQTLNLTIELTNLSEAQTQLLNLTIDLLMIISSGIFIFLYRHSKWNHPQVVKSKKRRTRRKGLMQDETDSQNPRSDVSRGD